MRLRDQSQGSLEVDTPSIDPTDLKGLRYKKEDRRIVKIEHLKKKL